MLWPALDRAGTLMKAWEPSTSTWNPRANAGSRHGWCTVAPESRTEPLSRWRMDDRYSRLPAARAIPFYKKSIKEDRRELRRESIQETLLFFPSNPPIYSTQLFHPAISPNPSSSPDQTPFSSTFTFISREFFISCPSAISAPPSPLHTQPARLPL